MDVKTWLESEWLGVQTVKDSLTKEGVILSKGALVDSKDKLYQNLEILIELDGKQKKYKMNKTTAKNLTAAWGTITDNWPGKRIKFEIGLLQGGREGIVGTPLA